MQTIKITNMLGDVILNHRTIKVIRPTVQYLANMHEIGQQISIINPSDPYIHPGMVQNESEYYYYFYNNLLYFLNEASDKQYERNIPLSTFAKKYILNADGGDDIALMMLAEKNSVPEDVEEYDYALYLFNNFAFTEIEKIQRIISNSFY